MSPELRIVSLATVLVLVAAAAVANIASGSSVRTVHVITGAQRLETLDFPPKQEPWRRLRVRRASPLGCPAATTKCFG